MGNDLESYRASIGCFNSRSGRHKFNNSWGEFQGTPSTLGMLVLLLTTCQNLVYAMLIALYILALCTDIHPNPGPRTDSTVKRVSFCNFNIRSIGTKDRFDHIIKKMGGTYDIITISETWLKEATPQTDFNLKDYSKPHRLDRPEGKAGGVMCYVKNSMVSKPRPDLGIDSLELLWVEITSNNHKLLVGTCYRKSG